MNWIKLEDEFPKEYERVLIHTIGNIYNTKPAEYIHIAWLVKNSPYDSNSWNAACYPRFSPMEFPTPKDLYQPYCFKSIGWLEFHIDEVTDWMPLPNNP